MSINQLIAQGFKPVEIESPMNQLAKVMQMRQAQQSLDQGEMKQQEYLTGLERKNKLVQLMSGLPADATDEQRSAALKGGGYLPEADALENAARERRKIDSESAARDIETRKKKIDLAGSAFKYAMDNPTLENAHLVIDYLGVNQVYTPEEVTHWKAQVAANPANIRQLAETAFRSALDAKDQLAKNTSENLGGNMAYNSVDPVTGKITQTGTAPITQSADNAASNARQAAEGAANRAVQVRGQNMTDARAKEANADGYSTKPLPTSALKMQNDAIDAIGTAVGINKMLSGVEQQITDKKVKFGPVSNLLNQGLNASGMSTEESRNFSSFKSNLEKIRNESLRLNSGVQTDGDAQRAWNELFQNINDTNLVKQRLGEIKSLNNRAVELQKLKVDGIRANYKAAPYDYGKLPDAGGAQATTQAKQQATANPQDAQALEWAKANPNDPRAVKIKQRLGQ